MEHFLPEDIDKETIKKDKFYDLFLSKKSANIWAPLCFYKMQDLFLHLYSYFQPDPEDQTWELLQK